MNAKRFEELTSRAKDALRQFRLDAAETIDSPLTAGDLFVLTSPKPLAAQWSAIIQNATDKELWYLVPCDDYNLLGSQDFAIPAHDRLDAMNARCGQGAWMHSAELPLSRRTGRLAVAYVQALRQRLAAIAHGSLSTDAELEETDQDYDYKEWINKIEATVESMEKTSQPVEESKSSVLSASLADQKWLQHVPEAHWNATETLAADNLAQEITVSPGLCLDFATWGTVIALVNPAGIHLHFYNSVCPELTHLQGDQNVQVKWRALPGFYQSSLIRWEHGLITLTCGSCKVTIHNQ